MTLARTHALIPLFLSASVAGGSALAGPAAAEPDPAYGKHVVHCTQEMGFSGDHNPGAHHQGFAGWPGVHEC